MNIPDAVFVLGIEMRCGTNYLWQLLRLHPQCHVGSVGEDYLMEYSELMEKYADRLYRKWTPEWRKRMGGSSGLLLENIGNCLLAFIKRPYYLYPGEKASDPQESLDSDFLNKILLTKTPSVKNLNLFFSLFPNSRLLVLVRDGRSVVESGIRSFDWKFEDAVRRWNKAANEIIRFIENDKDKTGRFRLVRYEDLVMEPANELKNIFAFLGLDHGQYDFDAAINLHVYGSSDIKQDGHKIHWKKSEKTKSFSPLRRWDKWDKKKHERYNWLAGEAQQKLGYSIQDDSPCNVLALLKHRLLDWKWKYRNFFKRIVRAI